MAFLAKLFLGLSLFLTLSAQADPSFTNITQGDFDKISKELSANFLHHSVQGAASLGKLWGFELGLVAGQTAVPNTNEIIKRSGGTDLPNLYHAGILGVLSVPFGITGEVLVTPKLNAAGLELEKQSFALKLSLNTELLQFIPFNLAFRGFSSTSKFNFKQNNSGINGTIEDKNTSTGIQLLASPSFPVVEPYVGVGYVTAKNDLSVTGTGTVFSNTYTSSQAADVSMNSTQVIAGVTAKLFASLGLEYSSAFGASTYSAKLAFGF